MAADLQSKLEAITADEDTAMTRQYELVEELDRHPDGLTAVESVLRLFERHPDFDFGSPGPLVHFIETFYRKGYEEELERSLSRRPTALTMWLVNRIINGSDGAIRERWIALLESVATSGTADARTRAQAADLLSLHR